MNRNEATTAGQTPLAGIFPGDRSRRVAPARVEREWL